MRSEPHGARPSRSSRLSTTYSLGEQDRVPCRWHIAFGGFSVAQWRGASKAQPGRRPKPAGCFELAQSGASGSHVLCAEGGVAPSSAPVRRSWGWSSAKQPGRRPKPAGCLCLELALSGVSCEPCALSECVQVAIVNRKSCCLQALTQRPSRHSSPSGSARSTPGPHLHHTRSHSTHCTFCSPRPGSGPAVPASACLCGFVFPNDKPESWND